MPDENARILIEMTDRPDCRFVSAWLAKVAEAEAIWSCALNDPCFSDRVMPLHVCGNPDLEAGALHIIGELEHWLGVAALALSSDGDDIIGREFALLLHLGFFAGVGLGYRLSMPDVISATSVKHAAFNMLSAVEVDGDGYELFRPGWLVDALPKEEAEVQRSIMLSMRRFRTITSRANVRR